MKFNTILFGLAIIFLIASCSQSSQDNKQIHATMKFRASFCDPLNPNIIELGDIPQDQIIIKFETIQWADYLQKMGNVKETEIYYSPSLEIENKESKHGLSISAVGEPNNYEFYIAYKRPKMIKTFFGLKEKLNGNYITNIEGQTKNDVIDALSALIKNDTEYLSNKIGQ
jgi:hypothetical protein